MQLSQTMSCLPDVSDYDHGFLISLCLLNGAPPDDQGQLLIVMIFDGYCTNTNL